MKLYKFNKRPTIAIWLIFIVATPLICFSPEHSIWIKALFVYLLIAWPLVQFTWTIGIDSDGIASLYSLGGRIFKIRKRINFQDIATVQLNGGDRVVIYPSQDAPCKFKDMIIIQGHIANRSELIQEIDKSTDKISSEVTALINNGSNQRVHSIAGSARSE